MNPYPSDKFNQLASTATATMRYDANGNTIQKSEGPNFWRYTWDYENRLTQASTRKQNVRYRYDALGRRVERNLGFGKERTKFTHDGLDVLVDDDAGTLTRYLNGTGIDNKLRFQSGANVSYFLNDHLGSTNGLTDALGVLSTQTAYDSFGNQTSTLQTRYGFTGRERDDFTGQMYYRSRFYAPNIGRFASEDPIGFGGGDPNLYGYVRNQPLWFRDPSGQQPGGDVLSQPSTWQAIGAAAAAAGAWVPPIAVAAAGAGAIYGAAKLGEYTASHPSNPFVNGPLNPFGNPYPSVRPIPYPGARPMPPVTVSPSSGKSYCQPRPRLFPFPRLIPFEYAPTTPWPSPPNDRDGCAQEWADAYEWCANNTGKPDSRGGTGGYTGLYDCARGLVSQRCGGNRVD